MLVDGMDDGKIVFHDDIPIRLYLTSLFSFFLIRPNLQFISISGGRRRVSEHEKWNFNALAAV